MGLGGRRWSRRCRMRVLALTLLFVPILSAQDKVSLKRTICFGSCPVYTLEISSDGSVIYDGEISVLVHGRHTATVSKDAAQELIRGFERLKFFEMKDVYKTNISDGPSEVLTLTLGGR